MGVYEELVARGLIAQVTDEEEIRELVNSGKATFYIGFDPKAESGVGAKGVMQRMPSSFEWLQEQRGCAGQYTEDDLFDPEICIDYGSYLLKYFYDYYGTERSAIAAYNAGFVVSDWLNDTNYSSDGKNLDSIPYPETKNYVDKVESAKEMYIKLYYSQSN